MRKPALNPDQALDQMRKYCAYQERCHQEVRFKLVAIGIRGETLEKIMGQLIEENFLDEERFARSYARGKFRQKQWGRQKISLELTRRGIGSYLQTKALEEIDQESYQQVLSDLLRKKKNSIPQYNEAEQRLRLFKFGYQRGFEPDIIYATIDLLY